MKIGYAVLAASLILAALPGAAQTASPQALRGASVGHFLRGFSAEFERVVDSNQEGDAGRAAGAFYGGARRDFRDRDRRQSVQPEDRPDLERPLPLKQRSSIDGEAHDLQRILKFGPLALHGGLPRLDRLLRALELEQADVADARA